VVAHGVWDAVERVRFLPSRLARVVKRYHAGLISPNMEFESPLRLHLARFGRIPARC
jgi:hypothetical protein